MSLEEIEKELYSSKSEIKKRGGVFKVQPEVAEQKERLVSEKWKEAKPASKKKFPMRQAGGNKWVKRILWISVFLIIVIIGGGIFFISQYSRTTHDVSVEISDVKEVYRGAIFEVNFNISNKSESILREASFILNLPAGIVALNSLNNPNLVDEAVGDIGAGSLTKKTYKFLAAGEEKSIQNMNAKFSYVMGSSRFEVQNSKEIFIKESAIEIRVKKPEQLLSGSVFNLDIEYKNISDSDFPELVLEAKYPSSFRFVSSDIPPESLNNRWRLGELKAGSKGSLQIKGSLEEVDGSAINIPFIAYGNFLGKDYQIVEKAVGLAIAPSPIGIDISLNRRSDYVARIGDKLIYNIQYKNNSGIALADVVIKATLTGELFDFGVLRTNALVDQTARTLTWNASNISALRLLDPGAHGEVNFDINLKSQFPIQRLNDKNFYLKLNVQIDSPSVPYYLSAAKTKAIANLETKVAGLIAVDAKAFYRDAQAGILNAGTLPPKVGQPTEYTIHWVIKNYSTDVRNIRVSAFLKPNVEWTGIVKSNVVSVPMYNDRTQEVAWDIEKILATKGVINDPIETVFQIRATPAQSHIGQYQPLIGETDLSAIDDFTGLELLGSDVALSTLLPDDVTVGQEGGRAVP